MRNQLGYPLYVNGRLFDEPVTISHVPANAAGVLSGAPDPSMGALGQYVDYAPTNGLGAPGDPPLPPPVRVGEPYAPGPSTGMIVYGLFTTLVTASLIYHGYRRNESVGWAIGWGILGGIAPVIALPVAIAQGFGDRKKGHTPNRPRRRHGRTYSPSEMIRLAARAAADRGADPVSEFNVSFEGKLGDLGLSRDQVWKQYLKAFNAQKNRKGRKRKHRRNNSDAAEFQRRRNLAGTTVRYMSTKRTMDVVLENRGTELGSRTDILKRGKVVSSTYFLPKLPEKFK